MISKAKDFPPPELGELDSGNIEPYLMRIGFREKALVKSRQSFAWNVQKLISIAHFLQDIRQQVCVSFSFPPSKKIKKKKINNNHKNSNSNSNFFRVLISLKRPERSFCKGMMFLKNLSKNQNCYQN